MLEDKIKRKEFSEEELGRRLQEVVLKVLTEETLTPEELEEIERMHKIMTYISPEELFEPFTI